MKFTFIKEGPITIMKESVKEQIAETTKETIEGILLGVKDFLVDTIGAISLVGCGLLILLKVAGYENGNKYAGILFTVNILIKYLLGGL